MLKATQGAFRLELPVWLTPLEGAPVEVQDFVFHESTQGIDAESGLPTLISRPRATIRRADLPTDFELEGATVEFPVGAHPRHPTGAVWTVETVEASGDGALELSLFKVEA